MADIIEHVGIVESIQDSHVRVRITQVSACATCSAKGYCSSADKKDKTVDVTHPGNFSYQVGDRVKIIGKSSIGWMAVLFAFVLPFLLVIISLFAFMAWMNNELYAAFFSLLILVPYYFILWLNRIRMRRNFSFTIKPINI